MKSRRFLSASTLLLVLPLASCVGGPKAGGTASPPTSAAQPVPDAVPPAPVGQKAALWNDLAPVEPPIQVVGVQGSLIYINRGQYSGVLPHATYNLFGTGEMLVDPITGLKLGPAETFLGRVRVARVTPRYSIVEPIGRLSGTAKVGNVLYVEGGETPWGQGFQHRKASKLSEK